MSDQVRVVNSLRVWWPQGGVVELMVVRHCIKNGGWLHQRGGCRPLAEGVGRIAAPPCVRCYKANGGGLVCSGVADVKGEWLWWRSMVVEVGSFLGSAML